STLLRFWLLLSKLLLPSQDSRLVSGFFGFRNHPQALISARNRGPRKNVVRLQNQNSARRFNRAVKIFAGVIRLRQAMKRVDQFRIELQRAVVFLNRRVEFALAEKINSS